MNKNFLFVALAFLFCNLSVAQEVEVEDKVKTSGGEGTLNFANTGFSDYWAGGGLGSTTINGLFNSYLNTKYENGSSWDNNLRLDYGVAKVQNTNGNHFTKSSDVFDFISKYGKPVKNSDRWYYSAAFNVLTQLTDTPTLWEDQNNDYSSLLGVNNNTLDTFGTNQSGFFAPGDVSLGLGFDYKPNETFTAFVGPLSTKLRIVGDDNIAKSGLFGNEVTIDNNNIITSYDKTRFEAGANVLANYNNRFLTNDMLSFATGLKLFSNYLEDPQNVDVNWNTVTSLNPWKFVTLTYSTDLAYDDNKQFTLLADGTGAGGVRKGVQFRNVVGIGLIHKLGDSK